MVKDFIFKSILSLSLLANNYVYPIHTPYILTTTNYGDLTIYFTSNVNNKLVYDDSIGYYVNISSSTIYGYGVYNGNNVTFVFPVLDQPYIRQSYSSTYLYFTSMSKGDVNNILLYNTALDSSYLTPVCLIGVLVMFCGLSLRRF